MSLGHLNQSFASPVSSIMQSTSSSSQSVSGGPVGLSSIVMSLIVVMSSEISSIVKDGVVVTSTSVIAVVVAPESY